MSSGGFGKGKSKSRQSTTIPDELKPFVNQVIGTSTGALRRLEDQVGTDQVADLTPDQLAALTLQRSRALGSGDFIPTMQDQLLQIAQGRSLNEILPVAGTDALQGRTDPRLDDLVANLSGLGSAIDPTSAATLRSAQSQQLSDLGLSDMVPDAAINALTGISGGTANPTAGQVSDLIGGATSGASANTLRGLLDTSNALPGVTQDALSGVAAQNAPVGQNVLNDLIASGAVPEQANAALSSVLDQAQTGGVPQLTRDTLESTARGDFLFGGQGFNQAVDAAVRAALPQIRSVFGSAGVGGFGGGLSQAAVGQAATDAFARQFQTARGRQLGAANTLAQLEQSDRARRSGETLSAAQILGDQGLRDAGFRVGTQGQLEAQDLARTGQQLSAATSLGGLSQAEAARNLQQQLSAATGLSQEELANAGLRLGAQGQLEGQRLTGQGQQLNAAGALANVGLAQGAQASQNALADRSQRLQNAAQQQNAAQVLASLGLSDASRQLQGQALSGDLLNAIAGRQLSGGNILAQLGNQELNRQLGAIGSLPSAATADVDLLGGVGDVFQQQEQAEIAGPRQLDQLILAAALSGLPLQTLLGREGSGRSSEFRLGGTMTV